MTMLGYRLLISRLHRCLRILKACAVFCLLVLPALATAGPGPCEAHARQSHLSLPVRQIESWEPVDAREVLVWTPHATRAHLLRLDRRLHGLSHAPVILLIDGDRDGTISACGHDAVLINRDAGSGGGRAYIRSIRYLSLKRTVELDRAGWKHKTIEAGLRPAGAGQPLG